MNKIKKMMIYSQLLLFSQNFIDITTKDNDLNLNVRCGAPMLVPQ